MRQIFYIFPIYWIFAYIFPYITYAQSTNSLLFDNQISQDYYLANLDSNSFYVYLNVQAITIPDSIPNTPLNIALVLDRSGSMKGAKLQYAKAATNFLIEKLTARDYLSIIVYDEEVQIIANSQPVKRKKKWYKLVENIWDGGATNLSDGMFSGFREVARHFKQGYVNRVLLLSDGLANKGITDPFKLQDTVQYVNQQQNITLSTFGLGADFDEDLLEALADKGGANYYFVPKAAEVATIFETELISLQAVMAQNATVTITLPTVLTLDTIYNFPYQLDSNNIQIYLNDVFSQEQKTVLLKLNKNLSDFNPPISITTTLQYDDIIQNKDSILLTHTFQILPTNEKEKIKSNQLVNQQITLFTANAGLSQAIKAVDEKDINKAKTLTLQHKQKMANYLANNSVDSTLHKQYEYIKAYEIHLQQLHTYNEYNTKLLQKSAKNNNYKVRRKK